MKSRLMITALIVDMHFAKPLQDFQDCRDREVLKWKQTPELVAFAD
jgi:hypothetical protein